MAEYIVHKAVELDKVQKKLRPTDKELTHEYIPQPKYDGCNMVAIKRANAADAVDLRSRTNEVVHSANHIKEALALAPFLAVGVYLGEYWHPTLDQPTVSGMFRKQSAQYTEPFFVVFDYLTLEEFEQGYSDLTYEERTRRLSPLFGLIEECKAPVFLAESQGFLIDDDLTPLEAANLLCKGGRYDGLILRKPSGKWKAGSGTTGEIIKIKPTLTLDLTVLRVNEAVGEKTGRAVYTLVVKLPNGNEQEVGSGVPHDWKALPCLGDIVEIEAMSYSTKGLLREPRYKGIRHDKVAPDA